MGAKTPAAEGAERSRSTRNVGYSTRTPRNPTAAHTHSTQNILNGKATRAHSAQVPSSCSPEPYGIVRGAVSAATPANLSLHQPPAIQ